MLQLAVMFEITGRLLTILVRWRWTSASAPLSVEGLWVTFDEHSEATIFGCELLVYSLADVSTKAVMELSHYFIQYVFLFDAKSRYDPRHLQI